MSNATHPSRTLTPRQASFAREYVANGGNATQAALAAGYVDNGNGSIRVTAARLLTRANVRSDINRRQQAIEINADYTLEQWRSKLLEDMQTARESGQLSVVAKYSELLGRHLGAFKDNNVDAAAAAGFAWLTEAMASVANDSSRVQGPNVIDTTAR